MSRKERNPRVSTRYRVTPDPLLYFPLYICPATHCTCSIARNVRALQHRPHVTQHRPHVTQHRPHVTTSSAARYSFSRINTRLQHHTPILFLRIFSLIQSIRECQKIFSHEVRRAQKIFNHEVRRTLPSRMLSWNRLRRSFMLHMLCLANVLGTVHAQKR